MRVFALVVLWVFGRYAAYAGEKLSGSNVDVRTYLAFKVSEAAVQKLVPPGWESSPPPAGPSKGFNVLVVLIDSLSASNAEGKPAAPLRGGVLVILAKKKGTEAAVPMVVFGIVVPEVAPGAYGVYVPGKAAIERKITSGADGKLTADETWEIKTADGNAIEAQLQYERGATTKSKVEQKVYSGAKPEFFRIYRVDQVTQIARSTATGGGPRHEGFVQGVRSDQLGALFDGSEQLISVTSIPSYVAHDFPPRLVSDSRARWRLLSLGRAAHDCVVLGKRADREVE